MELGGQDPAFENLLLLWRPVGIDLDEGAAQGQLLDLTYRDDGVLSRQVVYGVQAENGGEAVVGKRQLAAVA